jgi:hypothetical protein
MMQAGRHASLQRKPDGFSGQLSKEASIETAKTNVINLPWYNPQAGLAVTPPTLESLPAS